MRTPLRHHEFFLAVIAGLLTLTALGGGRSESAAAQQKPAAAPASQTRKPVVAVTARAHLAKAVAAAKKWRPDAVLIQVEGSRVNQDGTRVFWNYGAYSPSAKQCAVINVMNGQSNAAEAGGPECAGEPLPATFIDSDQAMKIARQNGITKPDVSMGVSAAPRGKGKFVWMVMEESMRNPGNLEIDIDALSGQVVDKTRTP